ncbi:MAG: hypothetical protein MI975_06870 [Cytophagales bacterium]|nr:hypothetical protein [Cytophagales bacterium]
MKNLVLVFLVFTVAFQGFIKKPVGHNGAISFKQIVAMANGDSEDDDPPPPFPPPGMPRPPQDTIPPGIYPVFFSAIIDR